MIQSILRGGCLVVGLAMATSAFAAERPNVLVILTDDQRWDSLDVMPAVEALAQEGVSFTNSFVTTALCAPSRASFYSGQYAHRHGVTNNPGAAPAFDGSRALPVWLQAAGYTTALFGKYMNGNDVLSPAVPPGWSVWQTFVEDGDKPSSDAVYYDYTLNEDGTL